MKIVTIVGARPQFVKAAVVSRAIKEYNLAIKDRTSSHYEPQVPSPTAIAEVIVHTGQHFDENMSNIFFEEMSIPKPDYNLDINGLGHGAMTGQMLEKIEKILILEQPNWVLVYGDTNSTLAGALAAKKLHIKVAHVEAGLRSFNMRMPEEINRILTDRISDILFCPTESAVRNLTKENLTSRVINIGDVMLDAANYYEKNARKLKNSNLPNNGFILATVHRAENTDDLSRLKGIFNALLEISKEVPVVLPLHPRTKAKLESLDLVLELSNLILIEPCSYFEMIWLLKSCSMVMTDSGGLQKEAYFFKKACVTLRDETEWVELIDHGYNKLAGADRETIVAHYNFFKSSKLDFSKELYGNGNAGSTVVKELVK